MDPLTAYRGNALGNLLPNRQQRTEAFKNLTATYRTKVEAENGRGAAFKALLQQIQDQLSGGAKSSGPVLNTSKAVAINEPDSGTPVRTPGDELGKDAFLQLLVTQMSNQDPLAPMDNSAMLAQLAQFSALEQMQNLNDQFSTFSGNVDQLNYVTAQGLIGRYVQGINGEGNIVKGFVESVGLDGSIVVLDVDGSALPMSGVLTVSDKAPEASGSTGGGS